MSSNFMQVEQEYKVEVEKKSEILGGYGNGISHKHNAVWVDTKHELTKSATEELVTKLKSDPNVVAIRVYHRTKLNWNGPSVCEKGWVCR